MAVLTLTACTFASSGDTVTISDPPGGLELTAIETYELTDTTFDAVDGSTFTAEQMRLHQATSGGSMSAGGGTRQVFGNDQGRAAAWNDITVLDGGRGLVLATWPVSGDDGIELVRTVRGPVSAAQFTDRTGNLVTAAASSVDIDRSHFIVWQQDGSWVALYSDTIPLLELASIARTVEPALLSDLETESAD